jgi:hypothetical protein
LTWTKKTAVILSVEAKPEVCRQGPPEEHRI